jgi:hypothetical protein
MQGTSRMSELMDSLLLKLRWQQWQLDLPEEQDNGSSVA